MGLSRPEAQNVDEFTVEISEEQIRMADGDHIFVAAFSGGSIGLNQQATLACPIPTRAQVISTACSDSRRTAESLFESAMPSGTMPV